jgi:hypothetical protein
MIELYQKVLLNRNFPEYDLKKGDVAILVDTVPDPSGGEDGYILEVFNDADESVNTVVVPFSSVELFDNEEDKKINGEFQQLVNWGVNWKNVVEKYQILILPENIEDYSDVNSPSGISELIDTDDAIFLSKLLKEKKVKCANSCDLGVTAKVSSNRSIEIRLGVIWILNHACLPILIAIVSRMIGDKVIEATKKNKKENIESPIVKANLKVLDSKISSASIEYNGDAQGFIKMLEGIQNEKS